MREANLNQSKLAKLTEGEVSPSALSTALSSDKPPSRVARELIKALERSGRGPFKRRELRDLAEAYLFPGANPDEDTRVFGVLLSSIGYSTFWGRVAGAIEEVAGPLEQRVVLTQHRNDVRNYFGDLYFFEEFEDLAGLIISPAYGTRRYSPADVVDHGKVIERFLQRGVPVLFIERQVPLPERVAAKVPFLSVNNQQAVQLAVDHLRDHRHQAIGALFDLPDLLTPQRERKEAFIAAMGSDYRPEWVRQTHDPSYVTRDQVRHHGRHNGREKARQLLSLPKPDRPTAVFCATYHLTLDVVQVAKELGLSIPEDISVVGFDDLVELEVAGPGITSVYYDLERLGRNAVNAIMDLQEQPMEQRGSSLPAWADPLPSYLFERKSVSRLA
jgi:DNA-binding LacI/PurR family transcriptional regulator